MLQKLRDQTQGTGFKILVGAIILVLVLFGFGATNLFLGADPELAQVGDFEITQNVLATETERERRRLLAQMGPDFDPASIDRLQLQQYVLQQLISRQILYQTARNLGIRMSPDEINEALLSGAAYQIDGEFNEAVYRQQVQALGFTPVSFVEEFTNALSSELLRGGIVDSAMLPEWELAEQVRVVDQRRDLAYLPLTIAQYLDRVEVGDEEVALRYSEDQSAYMTELLVDIAYVRLNAADLAGDPAIEVTEDELVSLYEEDRVAALADEQRDSSHILIQVNDERSDEQALQLITEIQTRLAAGETFEALAEELSEDPGSSALGGALGAMGKGIFDPAFEKALWALESVGDISAPILSSFGYHIIRLNKVKVPDYPAFSEQREGLLSRIRLSKAEALFADQALELERAAYEERFSLDATAQSLGLKVHKTKRVGRKTPADDSILSNTGVLNTLFSSEVLDGSNSEAISLGDSDVVIVRVDEQHAPEPILLEEVREDIRAAIGREKALAKIADAKSSGLVRLHAGESVTEISKSLGSQWQTFSMATRSGGAQQIPAAVRSVAFDLPRPAEGKKSVGVADLPDGAALVTVTRVKQGNMLTTTEADLAELRRILENRAARFDFQSFFTAAEEALGVNRPSG